MHISCFSLFATPKSRADIWASSVRVFDAAVAKAYNGKRKIAWLEVLAGEKAFRATGDWLPKATLDAFRKHLVGIKGPLTTPIGGGIRSLNVALRQELDLYVCLRPVRWFKGVPSPVKKPEDVDAVIFRENTEDIYAGIEFNAGSPEAKELFAWLTSKGVGKKVRFPESSAFGIKPVSREGTERLVRSAIQYALEQKRRSVTLVHKGNIMKATGECDTCSHTARVGGSNRSGAPRACHTQHTLPFTSRVRGWLSRLGLQAGNIQRVPRRCRH